MDVILHSDVNIFSKSWYVKVSTSKLTLLMFSDVSSLCVFARALQCSLSVVRRFVFISSISE